MTVRDALGLLDQTDDAGSAVIVLRNASGQLSGAPVLAVALDEESEDASLLIGEFGEDDETLDMAAPVSDIREALREIGADRLGWPLFITDSDDMGSGGSIVGHSTDSEVDVFAFLQGPRSAWEDGS